MNFRNAENDDAIGLQLVVAHADTHRSGSTRTHPRPRIEDFGRGFAAPAAGGKKSFLIPKVDVSESEAGLELTVELPGFDEKDISIEVHDGVMTLKAQHEEEHEEKDDKKHFHLVERSQGAFFRRFALPFEADADKANAHLDKGLLKVSIPRLASAEKRPTAIPVGNKA